MRVWKQITELPMRYGRITRGRNYVPQIDGLRFLAIAPVLFWHSCIRAARVHPDLPIRDAVAWLPHGHAGVDLFFFISGYIISWPFLAGRAPDLRAFFERRLLRLEPPYILAMTVAFLALLVTGYHPAAQDAQSFRGDIPLWQSFLSSLVYAHGLIFGAPSIINPPAWSLEVEVQFYLLSPLMIAGYLRAPPRLRRIGGVVLAVALLAVSCLLDQIYGRYGLHRWTLVGHAAPFVMGIVVCDRAIATGLPGANGGWRGDALFAAGLALWLGSALFWLDELRDFGPGLVRDLTRLTGVVMIYHGVMTGSVARGWMGRPWITLLGGMCYSIYLVHVMVMQAGAIVLAHVMPKMSLWAGYAVWFVLLTPLALVVALVFYLLVERPCMAPGWPIAAWRRIAGRRDRAHPDTAQRS